MGPYYHVVGERYKLVDLSDSRSSSSTELANAIPPGRYISTTILLDSDWSAYHHLSISANFWRCSRPITFRD